MELNVQEDLHTVLLGINLAAIKTKPEFTIGRWLVYNVGQVPHVAYESRNINYQINGQQYEKIVVRFFLTDSQTISKVKYYYLRTTDEELAFYLTMELIKRISQKYPLDKCYKLRKLS